MRNGINSRNILKKKWSLYGKEDMMGKALVLLSGGVDSTTCLHMAIKKYGASNVSAFNVSYGQKAQKEIDCAKYTCNKFGIQFYEMDLSQVFQFSNCYIVSGKDEIINKDNEEQSKSGEWSSGNGGYVPFRNGVFASVGAAIAWSIYPNEEVEIVLGSQYNDIFNADTTPEFCRKMSDAMQQGTFGKITLWAPISEMSKDEVIRTGLSLGVEYDHTWSCYRNSEKPCHKCGSCIDRENSFRKLGLVDPLCKE